MSKSLRRYALILDKIMGDHYPSFKDLKHFLERKSMEYSARTLQRDIADIRYLFGINVCFDHEKNGYYIDTSTPVDIDTFLRFLEVTCTAQLLLDSVSVGKEALNHLSFGTAGNMKGIQWLQPLLQAVQQRRYVKLTYQSFFDSNRKTFDLMPLLLREYLGRWYLVAQIEVGKRLYNFGLDRMLEVSVLTQRFTPDPNVTPEEAYKSIIGVTNDGSPVEKVRLGISPDQAKYFKTLPLHASQQIVRDDDTEFIIDIEVSPNYELIQRILMHGDGVRVLEPTSLVNEVKSTLSRALARYV